jgi:hypothetical protein
MAINDPSNPYGTADYNQAANTLGSASSYFQRSPASYDNAAARVRNRVNAQGNAQGQNIANQFQRRGLGNSNLQRNAVARNFSNTQQAYAGGLVDLEGKFAEQDIQRGQGLGQIGQQQVNLGQSRDAYGQATRGQDIQRELGLGEQALAQRGQDIQRDTTNRGQDIQKLLGQQNVLRDILGAQYEFGNTRLGAGDQATVDEIIRRLMAGES